MSGRHADQLRALARESRERRAEKLLDADAILAAAATASGQGFTALRWTPTELVANLAETAAAKRLEQRLIELGFTVRWETTVAATGAKGNPTGEAVDTALLRVSW